MYVRITVEPRSASVNVSCQDIVTGKKAYLDIGSMYTCILHNYDATPGEHTIQVTVVDQRTGYKQTKRVTFTLSA